MAPLMAAATAPLLLRLSLTGLPSAHSPSARSLAPPSARRHRRRSRHGRPRRRLPSCCLSLDRTDEDVSAAPPARSSSGLRVALAGGGTGGHIYPAIAIADEIRNADPDARVLFLGSGAGMETVAVPSAGYDFVSVPSVRLSRPIFLSPENLLLPFRLAVAVVACWKKLREFEPQVVVGTGGYVSAPVCLAAALLPEVRLVIQEKNSFPGIANRVLAPFAEKIFLAFPSSIRFFPTEKCVVSGNPVRLSLRRFVSKAVARSHFFPSASKSSGSTVQVVLVLGGSSGAYAINIAVLNMYSQMLSQHKNRFIIWQTGEDSFNEMESLVKSHRRLVLTPFLHTMDLAYAAADVVVSRAGAMTCTEILTTGKPSILIPSPNVAEDHQTKNANIMADIAGSKVLTEDELDSSTLEAAIDEILGDDSLMAEMSEKAMKSAMPNASTEIARSIIALSLSFTAK